MSYMNLFLKNSWKDKKLLLSLIAVAITTMSAMFALDFSLTDSAAVARPEFEAFQKQGEEGSKQASGPAISTGKTKECLRILPLGDSITRSDYYHLGYRYYLWTQLIDAGIDFDYVGSIRSHFGGDPELPNYRGQAFDRDHEGHDGWEAGCFLKGRPGKEDENLSKWLNSYTPDIVLMHVGTCDILYGDSINSTVDEIEQIIDILRADNPNVVILLAKLIPARKRETVVDDMNSEFERFAAKKSRRTSPIITVDLNSGFDPYNDLFDRVHPNIYGNKKIATKWFGAIQNVLAEGRIKRLRT